MCKTQKNVAVALHLIVAMAALAGGCCHSCAPAAHEHQAMYGPQGAAAVAGSDYIGVADGLNAWDTLPLFGKFLPVPLKPAIAATDVGPSPMPMELEVEELEIELRQSAAMAPVPSRANFRQHAAATQPVDPRDEELPNAPQLADASEHDQAPETALGHGPRLQSARQSSGWRARRD